MIESRSSSSPVVRRSVADQVANAIRNMILVGELRPNQRVTHDELAALLDVSTMPVREALLRLTYEGLIESRPGRSFRVAEATKSDVRDIYWVHGLLAGELTARAAKNATPDLIAQLRNLHDRWRALGSGEQPQVLEELNDQFHSLVNKSAQSPKLLVLLRNTLGLIPRHFYALIPAWSEVSLRGHAEILAAIERHDSEAARELAQRHVREAGELLIEYFIDLGYWTSPEGSVAASRRAPS